MCLTGIKKSIISKIICGLMLAGITLSFTRGILEISPRSAAIVKPVKVSNFKKQKVAKPYQTITDKTSPKYTNEEQADSSNIKAKSNAQNKYSVATNEATTSKPATNYHRKTMEPSKNSTNQYVDLNLLARVIYAESRGEPFLGQVAVGAVLLNRLNDSRFPKSLSKIIFKKGEFCTVRDGQIWKAPNQEAFKAARLAVAGWDPTNGALYFYNPSKTTSRWIWSRPVVNRIGNHIFAI